MTDTKTPAFQPSKEAVDESAQELWAQMAGKGDDAWDMLDDVTKDAARDEARDIILSAYAVDGTRVQALVEALERLAIVAEVYGRGIDDRKVNQEFWDALGHAHAALALFRQEESPNE